MSKHGTKRRAQTIQADIAPLFVHVLKLPQGLDDVDILPCPSDHELGALVETIIQNLKRFKHMAPVLAFVIQALVKHVHNLVEIGGTITEGIRQAQTKSVRATPTCQRSWRRSPPFLCRSGPMDRCWSLRIGQHDISSSGATHLDSNAQKEEHAHTSTRPAKLKGVSDAPFRTLTCTFE